MNLWCISARTSLGESNALRLAQGEYSIGSGPDAVIRVHGERISEQHANLVLGDARLTIRVQDPSGEISVNGRPVKGWAEAEYPALIQVGETALEVARFEERPSEESTQIIRRFDPQTVEAKQVEVWEQTLRIKRTGAAGQNADLVELKNPVAHEIPDLLRAGVAGFESPTLHLDMKGAEFVAEQSAGVQMAYRLKKEVARGGMGRIFAAEDPLLGCDVAVKVSNVQAESGDRQFEREAKVLANLAHPNIVPVHAMGVTPLGLPFYSMKLVRGKTLQSILMELQAGNPETLEQYPLKRLLRVFQKVCDAVGFAHAKGFLHRDLKPENVMSGEFGEVLVMDWGLALPFKKNSGGAPEEEAQSDEKGSLCIEGTPQYMSPEQAEGLVLDERSDIYALGALLYAILTKHAPVQGKTLEEVLTKVRRGELSPMTVKRAPLPSGGQNIPRAMGSGAPQALRAVTMKALSRDPGARYGSVAELKADVEAFQNGYATEAENASFVRQMTLLIMRHRTAAALVLVLILGAVAFTVRLAASEKQARLSAREASENAKEAQDNLAEAENNARRAEASSNKAEEEKEHARQETARAQLALAEAAEQDLNAEVMRSVLEKVPKDLRKQEWHYLRKRSDSSDLTIQAKNTSQWLSLMPHPIEPHIFITIQGDGWVRRLDLRTGVAKDLFKLDVVRLDRGATLSADGERIALARGLGKESPTGPPRQQLEVYSLTNPGVPIVAVLAWRFGEAATDLKFSPDGQFLLRTPKINHEESVAVLDSHSGTPLWERSGDGVRVAGFSEDSRSVYVYSERRGLVSFNAVDGTSTNPLPTSGEQPTTPSLFNHKGINHRISASKNWASLYEFKLDVCRKIVPKTGEVLFSFRVPTGKFNRNLLQVSYVKETESLATISPKSEKCGALQIWNSTNGYLIHSIPVYMELKGTDEWGILTHPVSSETVVTRGTEMKAWKALPSLGETALRATFVTGFTHKPGFVLQSLRRIPNDSRSPIDVGLLDLRENPPVKLAGPSFMVGPDAEPCVSQNGKFFCVRGATEKSELLSVQEIRDDGQFSEVFSTTPPRSSNSVQMSPSGHRIWCWDGVFDAHSGKLLLPLNRKGIAPSSGGFVRAWLNSSMVIEIGQTLTAETPEKEATFQQTLLLWNTETGTLATQKTAPEAVAVAAAPDGAQIAEAGLDMRVRIRNGMTLEVERQFRAHDEALTAVAWHPTLPLLATCAQDYTVKIWDLRTETLLETLVYSSQFLSTLYWSPDGASLLASEGGGALSYIFKPKALQSFHGK